MRGRFVKSENKQGNHMSVVREIRRTVLPKDIYDLIEAYMFGDITALHVIALSKNDQIISVSAGAVPDYIAANDSTPDEIARALP